ncbi:unnamed protein product [Caenorhabditis sp. 36 PRJEB53466]|nr:unnamed protein product [Caenorhabditis sp. 36 PRJEB53466]
MKSANDAKKELSLTVSTSTVLRTIQRFGVIVRQIMKPIPKMTDNHKALNCTKDSRRGDQLLQMPNNLLRRHHLPDAHGVSRIQCINCLAMHNVPNRMLESPEVPVPLDRLCSFPYSRRSDGSLFSPLVFRAAGFDVVVLFAGTRSGGNRGKEVEWQSETKIQICPQKMSKDILETMHQRNNHTLTNNSNHLHF